MAGLIALTGATGFIGQHLLRELPKRGYRLRVLLRRPTEVPVEATSAVIGDIVRPRNMAAALEGVDAIIHSAGLAHKMSGTPADDYRTLNTEATINLARAAQRAGVRRFIFLSSIRAQCGHSVDEVVSEAQAPHPTSSYGESKLAAEQGLQQFDLDWVALRLVLVYGSGVRGNIAALLRLADTTCPLPLGAFHNRRSLLSLDNLVAAIDTVLTAPGLLRRPLIVADRDALSIAEMVTAMRRGLARQPWLVPVPPGPMRFLLKLAGHDAMMARLGGTLVVDVSALSGLGWKPVVTTQEGLERLAREAAANKVV